MINRKICFHFKIKILKVIKGLVNFGMIKYYYNNLERVSSAKLSSKWNRRFRPFPTWTWRWCLTSRMYSTKTKRSASSRTSWARTSSSCWCPSPESKSNVSSISKPSACWTSGRSYVLFNLMIFSETTFIMVV